ncbi:adenylate/guanylate cyclase domain-containing protein [Nocardia neocaledoniensis]|uniref:adenylate/guanylate cyclase domain-containing protein n=1 Tax=Nocardia neocaledoniensis TaxID=236511 RepID=UPI002457008E|nr:adenylate/guanylate cyclase domain-containing protein [Nocardia neocaledoniensis]
MIHRDAATSTAPWGSPLLGPVEEKSAIRRVRVQLLLTLPLLIANLIGIAMTVVLAGFVLPGPTVFTRDLLLINVVFTPLCAVAALAVGTVWGTVAGLRTMRWATDPNHVPNAAERRVTASAPRWMVLQQAMLWTVALVVLTIVYGVAQAALIPKIMLAIGAAAIVVCANSYLIVEFALRPVTARVLRADPQRRRGIGVFGRTMLSWLVGVGVPVALSMTVAVWALADPAVSKARLAVCVLSLGGSALLFGMVLMAQVVAATVAPIKGVRQALRRVENGDLTAEIPLYDGTELGELQSGFNTMVHGLRERAMIEDLFGKHVGHDVAMAAIASKPVLGGTETEAAALFIDIIGSTTMAATLPAPEIVGILNRFFDIVVDEVERHGGLLNKFEGDAALAVFGTPAPLADAAGSALSCARAIQRRLRDASDLDAGIGVAAGRVVAGNVGTHNRYEFTVIGDAVNEAARLCELSKSYDERLLSSATTLAAAADTETAHWKLADTVTLRGRLVPTHLALPVLTDSDTDPTLSEASDAR